jgi:hypothetical protein
MPASEAKGAMMDQDNNMSSQSQWHESARARVAEMLEDFGSGSTDTTRRRRLMNMRPPEFSAGYPASVWRHEVLRATNGLPVAPAGPPLVGEWPMTARQRAFFEE